jgi:nonsense-mediated mRNA decay protein 3
VLTLFCVKCGKEGKVIDAVCQECFLKGKRFSKLEDHVNLIQCVHCEEYALDKKWLKKPGIAGAARAAAIGAVKLEKDSSIEKADARVLAADAANMRVHLDLVIGHRDLLIEEEADTIVRLKTGCCGRCSKLQGNYFESTLQIRGRERKLTEEEIDTMLDRVRKIVSRAQEENREVFISKIGRISGGAGGADVNLSTNSIGKVISRDLADQYGAEVKENAKLAGNMDGHDVFRVTYLVRLPAYRFGDIISVANKRYQVGPMRTTNVKLHELKSGEAVVSNHNDLLEAKVVAKKDELMDAVVLMETPKELQVMHPITMKPVDLRRPQKMEVKGETVKVLVVDDEIFLLPMQSSTHG